MIFIYLVENKNKIIGTYLDYSIAETFVLTLLQNNIINDIITINRYILNSGYCSNKIIFNQKPKIIVPIQIDNTIDNMKDNIDKIDNTKDNIDNTKYNMKDNTKDNTKDNIDNMKDNTKDNIDNTKDNINNNKIDNTKNYEMMEIVVKNKIDIQRNINILNKYKKKIIESKQVYENDIKLFNLFTNNLNNDSNFIIPELFIDKYKIFKKLTLENNVSWDSFNIEYDNIKNNNYNDYFKPNDYENNYEKINNNIEEEIIL